MHMSKMLKMRRRNGSAAKGIALFALGAAVGAGISMFRGNKSAPAPAAEENAQPMDIGL